MFDIFKKSKSKKITKTVSLDMKLSQTKNKLTHHLSRLLLGKNLLSKDIIDELEIILLSADVGISTTDKVINALKKQAKVNKPSNKEDLYQLLKNHLGDMLIQASPLDIQSHHPFVMLVIGVNGVGKTTTIGKLAKQFQAQDKSVMLAAGDTFRAAAVEQLNVWGVRNNITVVAQKIGADSAAVIYDALSSAISKQTDVLIADTAGRLHTQQNLMAELKKIKRILGKNRIDTPHETLLVLDGNIGGNAVSQAREFHQAIGIDSVVITKLDGSAKGGILFAICDELNLPIRYIGTGEGIDDLQHFNKQVFVDALF